MYVRFALKADNEVTISAAPLSAKSGLMQCSKKRSIRLPVAASLVGRSSMGLS